MPTGIGGLLSNLIMGDPGAQLARRMSLTDPITGQQTTASGATTLPAGSLSAPGATQAPGVSGTGQGGLPGAQVYAPDPTIAAGIAQLQQPAIGQSTGELMLKVHQQDQAAAALNRSLAGLAAGLDRADIARATSAVPGPENRLGVIEDIAPMQQQKNALDEHNRYMAHAAVFGRIAGLSPEDSMTAANAGILGSIVQTRLADMGPTTAKRNFDAAQAGTAAQVRIEHPDWTPDQVQREVNVRVPPSLLASGTGPLADQEYYQYAAAERASGRTPLGPIEWQEMHKNKAIVQEAQSKDAQQFKDSAIEDFSGVHQKLTQSEATVDQLLKNMPATMSALRLPEILTTSKLAANLPSFVDEATKQQALAMQKLIANLTGESLTNVKNVRNLREFNTLGSAATAALNANNGDEGVRQALLDIKKKFATAHAQAYATAGKEVPNEYAGLADERYMSPTVDGRPNPYYTGARYESPPKGGGAAAAAAPAGTNPLDLARDAISKGASRDKVIERLKQMGVDPTGL